MRMLIAFVKYENKISLKGQKCGQIKQ